MSKSRAAHMSRRKGQGVTYRQLGSEFGMSKSHAHRIVRAHEPDEDHKRDNPRKDMVVSGGNIIRDGYTRMGEAS